MSDQNETTEDPTPTKTAAAWKKARVHKDVTLPSGTKVDIEVPNLPKMIGSGTLPNSLIETALQARQQSEVTAETLKESWDFVRYIVPITVVEPKITEEDVDDLPIEDLEMIAGFAMRQNDIDAVGHHLGGLETVKSFREIRGLLSIDEVL